jgi:menaquinone-9 beta-reductase
MMTIHQNFDVVIVGAGIAGGALATRLARDGISVLLLERTLLHADRIRGEFLAQWGVLEAQQLGLVAELVAAGGHTITKSMRYGDGISIEAGRADPIDLAALVPGVDGVMTLGHPRLCETLDQAATDAGATLLRGVGAVSVEPGLPPSVNFEYQGQRHSFRPRLVVGADGRGSTVGRHIGVTVNSDPVHHMIAGLLIDDVPAWPENEQTASVHNGVYLLVFPQGRGRVRLYACYSNEQRGRFSGPRAAENFLEAFHVPTLPTELASGRIAGPCLSYPNNDTWVDDPTAPGVVLIGDAAGHNDPTIGQGLSIAIRDVRLVAEALKSTAEWCDGLFEPYAAERRERMRRLRFTARLWSKLRCEFDDEAAQRRTAFVQRVARDRAAGLVMMTPFVGPWAQPDEAFGETAVKHLLGDQWAVTENGWFRKTQQDGGITAAASASLANECRA